MKLLKTSDELIAHMKTRGIKFGIVNEKDAKLFLEKDNYYMKLASYRKNYDKAINGEMDGKYIKLEFAYLQELSIIDTYLRRLVLQMCLDIEHALKITIMQDIESNEQEDGYDIIRRFVTKYDRCCRNIQNHKSSNYCRGLIDKYYPYFPVWVFIELASFGDIVKLYEFYCERYPKRLKEGKLLCAVRDLRNATAHSNCLINQLHKEHNVPSAKISKFVSQIAGIGKAMRQTKLSNKFLCDFTTLLYVYREFIESEDVQIRGFADIQNLLNNRVIQNKEYFNKNTCIKSAYEFAKKIVDHMNE